MVELSSLSPSLTVAAFAVFQYMYYHHHTHSATATFLTSTLCSLCRLFAIFHEEAFILMSNIESLCLKFFGWSASFKISNPTAAERHMPVLIYAAYYSWYVQYCYLYLLIQFYISTDSTSLRARSSLPDTLNSVLSYTSCSHFMGARMIPCL